MRLEEKLAQLFMVGSDSVEPEAELEPFFKTGLGGFLLFRHHVQPYDSAPHFKEGLWALQKRFQGPGLSLVAIDQEGGQVERLPHWICPTGVNPRVLGDKGDVAFCRAINLAVARRMKWLGITLNFTPTVDLDRERMNPVIAQRAYGCDPNAVLPMAQAVIQSHLEAGVLPVAKHFPGHGSGHVDSHLDLPVFEAWQDDELAPYQTLIEAGLPAVLVAHGLYPKLAKRLGGPVEPSSLSSQIVTGLLRNTLGFEGLVLTDDMTMGAIAQSMDPVEAALKALEAGCDMLVYRRAQPEAQEVYEALLKRVHSGKFSESEVDARLARVLSAKSRVDKVLPLDYSDEDLSPESCRGLSVQWAQKALVEHVHQFVSPLPLYPETRWGLVYPDRAQMVHYGPDLAVGPDFEDQLRAVGLNPQWRVAYTPYGPDPGVGDLPSAGDLDVIVFLALNSHLHLGQQALYQRLVAQAPGAKRIVVSLAQSTDGEVLANPWVHIQLPSYRPQALEALVAYLTTPPKGFG